MAIKLDKFINNYHLVVVTGLSLHLYVGNKEHVLKFDPSYFSHQEITDQALFKTAVSSFLTLDKIQKLPIILAIADTLLYQQEYNTPSPALYHQFFSTVPFDNVISSVVTIPPKATAYAANADLINFLTGQLVTFLHTKIALTIPLNIYRTKADITGLRLNLKSLVPFAIFGPTPVSSSLRFPSVRLSAPESPNRQLPALIIVFICLIGVLVLVYQRSNYSRNISDDKSRAEVAAIATVIPTPTINIADVSIKITYPPTRYISRINTIKTKLSGLGFINIEAKSTGSYSKDVKSFIAIKTDALDDIAKKVLDDLLPTYPDITVIIDSQLDPADLEIRLGIVK